MKAVRIPGKPGRSKREQVADLAPHSDDGWYSLVSVYNVLKILDSPEEEGEPDMIQVTMTVEEAKGLGRMLSGMSASGQSFASTVIETLRPVTGGFK